MKAQTRLHCHLLIREQRHLDRLEQQLYALWLRYIAFDSNDLDSVLCLQLALGLIGSIPVGIEPCTMTDLSSEDSCST